MFSAHLVAAYRILLDASFKALHCFSNFSFLMDLVNSALHIPAYASELL